jgi:biopolymer transport protein ExbB
MIATGRQDFRRVEAKKMQKFRTAHGAFCSRPTASRPTAMALGIVAAATIAFAAWAQAPGAGTVLAAPATSQPAASAVAPSTQSAASPAAPAAVPPSASGAAPSIASVALPRDLSPWGMFLNADIVVKLIMIGLIFASLVTWTVFIAKNWEMWSASRDARAALTVLNQARTLAEAHARLGGGREPVAQLARTAMHEVQISTGADPDGMKERISWLLERVEVAAGRRIGRGMGLIASIGATAPFVGLFGTVWGIMNSFIGISNAHTTNLAVVAPGIAEALLATALGLFAAIPAVVIYNVFARSIGGYRALLADGTALVMRLVSRDGDRASAPNSSLTMSRAAAE